MSRVLCALVLPHLLPNHGGCAEGQPVPDPGTCAESEEWCDEGPFPPAPRDPKSRDASSSATDRLVEASASYLQHRTRLPCTEFAAEVLRKATGVGTHPPFDDGGSYWRDVNIWDPTRPLSPLDGVDTLHHVLVPGSPALLRQVFDDPNQVDAGVWMVMGLRRLRSDGSLDPKDVGAGHLFFLLVESGDTLQLHASTDQGARMERVDSPTAALSGYRAGWGAVRLDGALDP